MSDSPHPVDPETATPAAKLITAIAPLANELPGDPVTRLAMLVVACSLAARYDGRQSRLTASSALSVPTSIAKARREHTRTVH